MVNCIKIKEGKKKCCESVVRKCRNNTIQLVIARMEK